MTTDNRANETTPEQVEAAARAYDPEAWAARDKYAADGTGTQVELDLMVEYSLGKARAALEAAARAAQGAAPQAESAAKSSYISPSLPAMIRNLWKSDPSENSVRTALKLAGDLIQELIDLKAAPMLPSSGVDEERLAEVIEAHVLGEPNGGTSSWAWVNCSCGHRIEIAGVTRERVVALGRMHQARAVSEWLKGQGR